MAKRAYILVKPDMFGEIFKNGNESEWLQINSLIPEDAEFISSFYDFERGSFMVLYQHESFEDIPEGKKYPQIRPPFITKRIMEEGEN